MDLTELTIIEARKGLSQKAFSCVEYVDALIAETVSRQQLNCYLHFDGEQLRASAAAFDASPGDGLLAGIPIAIKDNIDVAGVATTAGTAALKRHFPDQHAPVAQSLFAAGALFGGKANMHELAFGITSNNGVFGACRNPYDLSLIAGGSSGGCGALLAARLAPGAIGTDTGGSVRIPAALCGVTGLRPSSGRYAQQGIVPISHTRDTAGPMARSVADVVLLDQVISGSTGQHHALPPAGLRLGVLRQPSWQALDQEVQAVAEQSLVRLKDAGVTLVEVAMENLASLNAAVGFAIVLYEFLVDLPAYLKAADAKAELLKVLREVGSPDVASIIQMAIDTPVAAAAYEQALLQRKLLQAAYQDCFREHQLDALIFPTTPLTARPVGDDHSVLLNGAREPTFFSFARNTDGASNAGIPGISVPAGLSSQGLPVGLELDGPAMQDRRLLQVAATVEEILGPLARPPRRQR